MLAGRNVVLGITGGVAAYKSAYLARRLVERGAEVRPVMTASAGRFIGPQTIAAITGNAPVLDLFEAPSVSPHTDLGRWADVLVVAPLTAASLARIAHGLAEDALTATVLAFDGPVVLAPAMHTEMWLHQATRRNVAAIGEFGYHLVGPVEGDLAGGDVGLGRMAEPDEIVAVVEDVLAGHTSDVGELSGWSVLVSAGGTREPIDPVRYVGNRSSGKMGHAIAVEAARRGAEVVLVTTAAPPDVAGIRSIGVESAEEMASAVWSEAKSCDVAVLAAAVADWRPRSPADDKLRRAEGLPVVEFESTPDILAGVAALEPRPFLVGFAAEVGSLDGAIAKAKEKGVDLLVGNDVSKPGSGFGSDTNEVVLILPDGTSEAWELMTKTDVAVRLWDEIIARRAGREPA